MNEMNSFLEYFERHSYIAHVMFWLSIFLMQTFATGDMNGSYLDRSVHYSIILIPKIAASYLLVYYLVPKLFFKRKYLSFIILFVLTCYVICVGARVLVVYVTEGLILSRPFPQEPILEILTDIKKLYMSYFLGIYYPAFVLLILSLLKESLEKRSVVEKLEQEKVKAELSFLKSQIHPHFLFNTLNNLYALTLKKSDKAPETVLKLSEILDYMIYQCNGPEISIEKEVKLIENYVALEQLRYGDKLELRLKMEIDNAQTKITPLLLISIIENAFKHGVSGNISNSEVTIDIKVEKSQLYFKVVNTKPLLEQKDETNFKKGIGLKNTRKQLALIYPNSNDIHIHEDDSTYTVVLKIDLKK